MQFTCEKNRLMEGLHLVGRVVSSRTPLPILECVLLVVSADGTLTLSANDMEISINTAPIPAEVEVPGAVALNARLLTEIVRKMPGDLVRIECDEKLNTLCKSGRARFNIGGMPADEFPVMPQAEPTAGYSLPAVVLKDMIRQTIFSVSPDHSKPILTGELLEIKNNSFTLVALDSYRLSFRHEVVQEDLKDHSVVLSAKTLGELSRALPAEEDYPVNFYFSDRWAVFETSHFSFMSRLLDGEFPPYERLLHEDFSTLVVVERLPLLNALERAVLIAQENKLSQVRLNIEDEFIVITSNTDMGQAYDEVTCETDGKPIEINFNSRYLIEALRVIDDEKILLKFNGAGSPLIIRSVKEDAYKYLIAPVR